MADPTPADRLALAVCLALPSNKGIRCRVICPSCRRDSAAVARELAQILRERHGSSQVADWLDGIGCHPGTVQTVQQP